MPQALIVPACCQGCGPAKPDRGQESVSQTPATRRKTKTVPSGPQARSYRQVLDPPVVVADGGTADAAGVAGRVAARLKGEASQTETCCFCLHAPAVK